LGGSPLFEYATYVSTSLLTGQDALNLLLLEESGSARNAIFDAKITVAACLNGYSEQRRTFMVEFQGARQFTDSATVNSACTLTQNFGGIYCDQYGRAKDFFNAINSIRVNPKPFTNVLFASQLKAWQEGFAISSVSTNS
jgi:hypothetical protein